LIYYPTSKSDQAPRPTLPQDPHNNGRSSQTQLCQVWTILLVTPDTLIRTVQDFLSEASGAVVLEDGAVTFDLGQAKYSISGDYNKCLLHLWSPERNTMRRVLDAEVKNAILKLAVQRLGQSRPTRLEICRERDRRSASAKRAARTNYEPKLRRALDRHFPGFTVARLTTAIDLEKSFGPIYTRGLLRKGQSAFAILGVNASETQASVDAALTFGILWLEACGHSSAGKFLVEGLHLFVPHGCSALSRERMANLNPAAAKWSLLELDERYDALVEIDCTDRGNVATRLVHATNETAARERFAESIARIQTICPTARSLCPPPQSLCSAGADWSSLAPAWERKRRRSGAGRKSSSE
jgi:hypothetical protein